MSRFRFVATHGVQFSDSDARVWADFQRDRALDTPDGEKRYVFETDDAETAKRLRAVKDYGIAEQKRGTADKQSDDA